MLAPEKLLNLDFLEARCQVLEIAALLDRYDRAVERTSNGKQTDPRVEKLYQALKQLADPNAGPDRSEQLLLLFSDPA